MPVIRSEEGRQAGQNVLVSMCRDLVKGLGCQVRYSQIIMWLAMVEAASCDKKLQLWNAHGHIGFSFGRAQLPKSCAILAVSVDWKAAMNLQEECAGPGSGHA